MNWRPNKVILKILLGVKISNGKTGFKTVIGSKNAILYENNGVEKPLLNTIYFRSNKKGLTL